MGKNHLKRLNAPKTWPISRKGSKWITKQNPGPHKLNESMPLNIIIRDLLIYAKTTKEVKNILSNKDILINKRVIKEKKFPVGTFDIIEIPKTKENFLFLLNKKGKFFLQKIDDKKAEVKHLKIIGKKVLKKNKLQINLYNGNNFLTDKKEYNVGDTLLINLKDKKILKHLKLEKNADVYIIDGKYVGLTGTVESLSSNKKNDTIDLKINNKNVKTLKKYIFVIDKALIK
ncbi:30S ribosomal protein S4e [Candidatus Woesearchaeota archaeon]|nr:30S ribosomal protein S4e [Candidatus Woesearchaeota archaeon]